MTRKPPVPHEGSSIFFTRLNVQHVNSHALYVTRRKEFAPVTPEIGAYQLLVCLALDVDMGIQKTVALQFAHHISQGTRLEFEGVVGVEYRRITFLDVVENLAEPAFDGQSAVIAGFFLGGGIEIQRLRYIALIVDFAKYHFQ